MSKLLKKNANMINVIASVSCSYDRKCFKYFFDV